MPLVSAIRWAVLLIYLRIFIGAGMTFRKTGEMRGRTLPFVITIWILGAQLQTHEPYTPMLVPAGVLMAGGLALFQWASNAVRGQFFSYLGDSDIPQFVFQKGPFAYIRNPFYCSYILVNLGVMLLVTNWITVAAAVACIVILDQAARFEERKFESSPVAEEYREYKARTGRFVPKLPRR